MVGFTAWTLDGPGKCCNDALIKAGRVCEQLGVPYDTVDLRAMFSHYVLDYYNRSYAEGLTPNPCVECNQYVKWEALAAYAREALGADFLATGHYARIDRRGGRPRLFRAADARKDRTYLWPAFALRIWKPRCFRSAISSSRKWWPWPARWALPKPTARKVRTSVLR